MLDTTKLREDRDDLRMEIIHILEEVSGDIWCDCEPVNKVINDVFDRLTESHQKSLLEEVEKLFAQRHEELEDQYLEEKDEHTATRMFELKLWRDNIKALLTKNLEI